MTTWPSNFCMSNAELRAIADRRAEADEDVARLIGFILYLKRKLGKADRHIEEQRKHLNAVRIKDAKDGKETT